MNIEGKKLIIIMQLTTMTNSTIYFPLLNERDLE